MNRIEPTDGDIIKGESNYSLLDDLIQKQNKTEMGIQKRRETIQFFLEGNAWPETNLWREQINGIYERIDWSLLYRIDRDSALVNQGVERLRTGENIKERLALSLKMREKLIAIYKALQSRDMSSNNKESDRQRWLEKFKGLLGVDTINSFDLDKFFETPKERKMRERKERGEKGMDFRERILNELKIANEVRLYFPWQKVPEEIFTNVRSAILSICCLEAEKENHIMPIEK